MENSASCGQHARLRWTDVRLRWTACGRLKNHENSRRTLLCSARLWLYNFSTSENGYHSEGTSGDLGETPGSLKGTPGTSERSVVRRQLRTSGRALRVFRGQPWRDQGVGSEEAGRLGNRALSGCPGPVVGRTECGSLIAPADQLAGAIGGVSPNRPGEAPASHTCGGLVILMVGRHLWPGNCCLLGLLPPGVRCQAWPMRPRGRDIAAARPGRCGRKCRDSESARPAECRRETERMQSVTAWHRPAIRKQTQAA